MANYASLQTSTAASILRAGLSVTVRSVAETFNSTTGAVATVNTDYTASAVLLPMGEAAKSFGAGSSAFSDLFDAAVKQERRFCLLSADFAAVPKTGDLLIAGSDTWEIVGVDALTPDATTTVLYQIGLQK